MANPQNNTPKQANFQTTQNFNIDIDVIYKDFITEIDDNRSITNTNVAVTALNVLDVKTIAGLSRFLKIEQTPQESRAHAFYRLIGFPVVAKDFSYYNPGLDTLQNKTIHLSDKINIANNIDHTFKQLSLLRENYVNSLLNVFAVTPTTITASVLALTSSIHTRSFTAPIAKSIDPFSFDVSDQQYNGNFSTVIGANNQIELTQYMDEFGTTPDAASLKYVRHHFIKPFIVDPRIDFSVNPASRRVAVPFVDSKKNLLVGENTYVKRPLIEKVIRDRFLQNVSSTLSTAQQQLSDFILQVPAVKNEEIIQQMIKGAYKLDVLAQFQKFLYIIQAMCKKLVEAQNNMQKVQGLYYWLPLPSTIGPENGSDIKGIIISQKLSDGDNFTFITTRDRDIINATLNQSANNFNALTAEQQGIPDLGQFAFSSSSGSPFDLTFDQDTTTSLGDETTKNLTHLNQVRDHDLSIANDALRTTEIIMGEFSGLGLCDIIAVMGALYTMPQNDLLGFLDTDAFQRMIISLNLQSNNLSNPGIQQAQTSFVKKVKDFYNLMDDIYKNLAQNNGVGQLSSRFSR